MKFNLKTLLSAGIALIIVLILSFFQDITWVKFILFGLLGYVLVIFGVGMREVAKKYFSGNEDKKRNS